MEQIVLLDAPVAPGARSTIFLPIIATSPGETQTAVFYRLIRTDKRQQRKRITICPELEAAAKFRAEDLASRRYWAHCTPEGLCPNEIARMFGCQLPKSYGDGNTIEELGAGSPHAESIFNALARSPAHRTHLFGENAFFRQQTHMGAAVAEGGPWGWFWCLLIAICEGKNESH